ncbi:hypothetical protein PHYSODRAFT_251972 [Phytophthora sojae]|uniref:Uncharacterized protein n=1 Tax=Phytophthora sojae (strain P6497) TaxID=1094619 RepID=G5ABE1_PHYSP|nr:hypothetical protein PHYSODRAFT_251972 [Phytophthora sojae]EGZ06666.1 hypothetical protein PHYSODRAFT_251972 [Phytophthora sojae]|eukprot:XP_009537430.1 hypothetical protein PHYSODRAFT_251972 [Phytophthora sojae]
MPEQELGQRAAARAHQKRDQDQEQHSEDEDKEQLEARQRKDMDMNSCTPIAFEADLLAERTLFLVARSSSYAALIAGKHHMFWIQVQGASTNRRADPSTWARDCRRAASYVFACSRKSYHHRRLREGEEQRRLRRYTPLGAEKYELGPMYTFDNLALGSKADDYVGVVNTMKGNPCEDPVTPLILGTAPLLLHVCHSYEADDSC